MSEDLKIKTAAGKPVLALLPLKALIGPARIAEYGAQKYARGNWYNGSDDLAPERYIAAALRHLTSCQNPDGTFTWVSLSACDEESNGYHLDHAILGLLYLRGMAIRVGIMEQDPGHLVYTRPA